MHTDSPAPQALWEELENTSTNALILANRIAGQLRQGSVAQTLTPLLQQAQALACQAQDQIQRLAANPSHPQAAVHRDRILEQMRQWLALEEQNHRICSSRGVSLTNQRRRPAKKNRQPVHPPLNPTLNPHHPTCKTH